MIDYRYGAPDTFLKTIVYVKLYEVENNVKTGNVEDDVKSIDVKVDVHEQFTTEHEFVEREHMLQWIRIAVAKLGFNVIIGRSDNGSNRRHTFVTMRCETSGTYQQPIRKLKQDDTKSRKCDFPFKVRGYRKANSTWKFNAVSGIHSHYFCHKLASHPIVCRLDPEEKEFVSYLTLNMVPPKNILETLKRKMPQNVSNIKQIYNVQAVNNKVTR